MHKFIDQLKTWLKWLNLVSAAVAARMGRFIDRFEIWFNWLNVFCAAFAAISIAAFAFLTPLDLLLRKLGWGNFPWLHEGTEYVLYVGVFLSAAWVLSKGAHVRVDILVTAVPKRAAFRLEQGLDFAGSLLCLALCYFGLEAALVEFADDAMPDKDLRIANWYMMAVFAVSFVLLAIEFLLRARRAREIMAKEAAEIAKAGL